MHRYDAVVTHVGVSNSPWSVWQPIERAQGIAGQQGPAQVMLKCWQPLSVQPLKLASSGRWGWGTVLLGQLHKSSVAEGACALLCCCQRWLLLPLHTPLAPGSVGLGYPVRPVRLAPVIFDSQFVVAWCLYRGVTCGWDCRWSPCGVVVEAAARWFRDQPAKLVLEFRCCCNKSSGCRRPECLGQVTHSPPRKQFGQSPP